MTIHIINPIANAVEHHRAAAVERALTFAREFVVKATKLLEENGWDLNKAAPRPNGHMTRAGYRQAQDARNAILAIVKELPRSGIYRIDSPIFVQVTTDRVQRYYAIVRADASASFDTYVAKLTAKIGPVRTACIDSAYLWNGSVLTVGKPDGTTERWHTQMIINVSVLGKLFNQWPTRKLKG